MWGLLCRSCPGFPDRLLDWRRGIGQGLRSSSGPPGSKQSGWPCGLAPVTARRESTVSKIGRNMVRSGKTIAALDTRRGACSGTTCLAGLPVAALAQDSAGRRSASAAPPPAAARRRRRADHHPADRRGRRPAARAGDDPVSYIQLRPGQPYTRWCGRPGAEGPLRDRTVRRRPDPQRRAATS